MDHWFYSSENKRQYVTINGSNSSIKQIWTDVQQGSVLRSLLFLACINDLCKCVNYSLIYHSVDDANMPHSSCVFNKLSLPLMLQKHNQLFSTQVPRRLARSLKFKIYKWEEINTNWHNKIPWFPLIRYIIIYCDGYNK